MSVRGTHARTNAHAHTHANAHTRVYRSHAVIKQLYYQMPTDCLATTAREEEEEEEEEQQQQQQGRAERSEWPSEAQQKQAHICVRAGLQH